MAALRLHHLDLEEPLPRNASRLIALATWRRPAHSPLAYAGFDLDLTRALAAIEARKQLGEAPTLTTFFAAAVGRVLRATPEMRSVIRFGRAYPRKQVSLLAQVAVDRDRLSGYLIRDPDRKSPSAIAHELAEGIARLRAGAADPYAGAQALMNRLPVPVAGRALEALGWACYELNLNPELLGLPHDMFGAMRLNNVGALGIDDAVGPYIPWMRSPGTWVLTRVRREAVPVGDGFEARSRMKLWVGLDHRLADGGMVPSALLVLRRYLDEPEALWA